MIASLLSLQSASVRDPEDAALFERSRERVISMSLVHEQLLQADDLALIPFQPYLESLVTHIHHGHGNEGIELSIACEEISLEIDRAVPCGLIVTELTTNALEHAFPANRSGAVAIGFAKEGDRYRLTVVDNGVGLPEDLDRSLGMTLVETLTTQLHGELSFLSSDGTSAEISFPR